jgi:NRPS condensation-like uncharacterized protein
VFTQKADAYEAFKREGIDFIAGPQIFACLYRCEASDKLILKVSHLVSDAAGVKEIAATLAELYGRLENEPEPEPTPNRCDQRGLWHIVRHVPWYVLPRIVYNYLCEVKSSHIPYKTHGAPMENTPKDADEYVIRHIDREALAQMVNYAKMHTATINDLLLAAIFRALSKIGEWDPKTALRVGMTIDLRRYLPAKRAASIANFSSIEMMTYGTAMEDEFASTLDRVVEMVNTRKSSWLGLSAFVSTYIGIWSLPFFLLKALVQKGGASKANSPNGFDWFTNMGKIQADKVDFGGKPTRAWLLPPGCNFPILFFGCSGYDGGLTLSASIMTDADGLNAATTNRFFDLVISELPLTGGR